MQRQQGVERCLRKLSRFRLKQGIWTDVRRTVHSSQSTTQANVLPPPPPPPAEPIKHAATQGATTPPPKSSGGAGVAVVATAASIAAGVYYYYNFIVDPAVGPRAYSPADPPTSPVSLLDPPKELTPQQELSLRRDMLRAELEHLRSQKRTKYIDAKKKDIKDELKTLDGRIRKLSS